MSNSFSENLRQRFNKKISLKRKEATPLTCYLEGWRELPYITTNNW